MFKGMNKDMQCQGFQFELGKEYKETDIKLCSKGFHACENPLDVWSYYNPVDDNRFFEVEQSGKTETDGEKTVSEEIHIKAELKLMDFIKIGVDFLMKKAKSIKETSGDNAPAATSGYNAPAATSGRYAPAATSGNNAPAATSGEESIACAIGVQSKAKAVKSWIVLTDWRYDGGWKIKNIYHAKIGQKIKGTKIKPDVWYWFKEGKLNSHESL